MNQYGLQLHLEALREAREAWLRANRQHQSDVAFIVRRLLFETAANRLPAEWFARHSGMSLKSVRIAMRNNGLNPKSGKSLLSKTASAALLENAELLGVEPNEIDLMSPLAYLPMGQRWRDELTADPIDTDQIEAEGNLEALIGKLDDAGVPRDQAVEWVNSVIDAGVRA